MQSEPDLPAAEWVPLAQLVEWNGNPRKNDSAVAEVVKSIVRFGFGAPLVANRRDSTLIAGHTRLAAARRLKLDVVPVRWLDLSPDEAHALALADNRLGEIASWDDDKLAAVLVDLRKSDDALLAATGFTDLQIAALLDAPSFNPTSGPQTPLDTTPPIVCPQCGHSWHK